VRFALNSHTPAEQPAHRIHRIGYTKDQAHQSVRFLFVTLK